MRQLHLAVGPVLLLLCAAALVSPVSCERSTNETAAREWFQKFDRELAAQRNTAYEATWNNAVNITAENIAKMIQAELDLAEFLKAKRADMQQFDWGNFTDNNLTRLFSKADDIGTSVASAEKQKLYGQLRADLAAAYNTAKVKHPVTGQMVPLEPDIVTELANPSQTESVKRALWTGWRDASGKVMRQNYTDFVALGNQMIQEAGYDNMKLYWQSWYEPRGDFEQSMARLWDELAPFYKLMHAYVRRELKKHFGAGIFPPTGQMPAHILGNMWAQSWANVETLTIPFPDAWKVDITKEMISKGWNASKMFQVSEEFFTSLGLDRMTDSFWEKSVIERLPGVEMNCHASAWDFYTGRGDFRIKQCTSVTLSYLATTHHEMGHVQYFQQYEKQPVMFRQGANPGFHEAVGDTLELSVMTPEHLVKIGLLNSTIDSEEYYIDYMFLMALKKIAFIPFGYLIDLWRWQVFTGAVKPADYNTAWWKLRCDLQGIASPVRRSESDFDPGAKYHVPGNTPYIRYFISHFLQFQFFEALCIKAGHTGPLHKCDFYRSTVAGDALKKMLALGSSKHWEDALFELTGTRSISAGPLLRYFEPLISFLKTSVNATGEEVGWKPECPPDDWYLETTTAPPVATTTKAAGRAADASAVGFTGVAASTALLLLLRQLLQGAA